MMMMMILFITISSACLAQIKTHFQKLAGQTPPRHPIIENVIGEDNDVEEAWELGYCDQIPKMK